MNLRIAIAGLIFSSTLFAAPDLVTDSGKAPKKLKTSEISKLKSHVIEVNDPNESKPGQPAFKSYRGVDGRELFDLAFGGRKNWTTSKKIEFNCADGYRPSLETKDFINGDFYFATEIVGSKSFTVVNHRKDSKVSELGPYYVVWSSKSKQLPENSFYWPYQVIGIALK